MEMTFEEKLKNGEYVGIVEDNADPDKKQRVRVRVPYLHGDKKDIPTSAIPWSQPKRDNNGLSFQVPDMGKIVNVTFPTGNLYYSVYDNAQHLNINLQKKVEEYSGDDYTAFIAMLYNHNTQIFVENEKGLNIIHKFNGLNVKDKEVTVLLKDNDTTLYLGDPTASQEAMLGTSWMAWMDTLVQALMDPYIGNNGAPVIANPAMINVLTQYQAKRKDFLSKHIYNVDNDQIRQKDFDVDGQLGDNIEQTNKAKGLNITQAPIDYKPKPSNEPRGIAEQQEYVPPGGNEAALEANPVESEIDKEVDKLIRYMKKQNYTVYEDKFRLNIVGIRNKQKDDGIISNKFDDWIHVFYKGDDDKWNLVKYNVTTTPGFTPNSKKLPTSNGGAAMLVYAQLVDKFKIGFHQNRTGKAGGKTKKDGSLAPEHKALVQATTAQIRNKPGDTAYAKPGSKTAQQGAIGINIHHASETGTTSDVYNYSEGCQVFASKNQHDEFMTLCEQQVDKTKKGMFTYTLIPQKELDDFA